MKFLIASVVVLGVFAGCASVPESNLSDSNQPYIDQLKTKLAEKDRDQDKKEITSTPQNPDPYIQSIKDKMAVDDISSKPTTSSYIDELKAKEPERFKNKETSFIEQEKAKLPPKDSVSAIEAVKQGKSDLSLKIPGNIRHFASLRMATSNSRSITSNMGAREFKDVYSDEALKEIFGIAWYPEFTIQYGYIPFRNEYVGNLGLTLTGGASYIPGKGSFEYTLTNPKTNVEFGAKSRTTFTFWSFPATASLTFQFNTLWLFRPYINAGPTAILYFENRSDDQPTRQGKSFSLSTGGGVNLLLDWISNRSAWDLYDAYGVKHYYLTLDYTRMTPISGNVRFSNSVLSVGLAYEF